MSATIQQVDGSDAASILNEIHSALRNLRFGSVEITVITARSCRSNVKKKSACKAATAARRETPAQENPARLDHQTACHDHEPI